MIFRISVTKDLIPDPAQIANVHHPTAGLLMFAISVAGYLVV